MLLPGNVSNCLPPTAPSLYKHFFCSQTGCGAPSPHRENKPWSAAEERVTPPCPILPTLSPTLYLSWSSVRSHHSLLTLGPGSDQEPWHSLTVLLVGLITGIKVIGGEERSCPGLKVMCQDTCEMSLTRVRMSWRHNGHVSSCKAHSIHIPLCPQGLSSVSAIWSQQRVQQLSLMLTCFSRARRRCLGRIIFSSDASEAKSLKVLNLTDGGWRKGFAPKLNSHCW